MSAPRLARAALALACALVWLPAAPTVARPQPAAADSAPPPRPWWINVGLVGASDDMLGAGVSLTVARSAERVITVRTFAAEEWSWCWGGPCAPSDQNADVGVLYGVAHQSRWYVASLAAGAGIAAIRRTVAGPTRTTRQLAPGVPIEGQLFVRPFRNVGLGVAVMADVNTRHSFAGTLVGLQLGRLTPPWGAPGR